MIAVGETFLWVGDGNGAHLYIALNDSGNFQGQVAMVNITHTNGGPMAFKLNVGDHPYVTKPSDINLGDAAIFEDWLLEGEVKCYNAIPNDNMDLELAKKIAVATLNHGGPSKDFKKIIRAQWGL